jgi:hypothetical protein
VEWVPAVGHHFDVHVLREDEDGCAGVAAADADVVQPTVVPQDERAVRVDLVVADTEVGLPTAGPKKNDVAGHLRMVSCDIPGGAGDGNRTRMASLAGWRSLSPMQASGSANRSVVKVKVGPPAAHVVMLRRRMLAGGRRCASSSRAGQQCPGSSYRGQ